MFAITFLILTGMLLAWACLDAGEDLDSTHVEKMHMRRIRALCRKNTHNPRAPKKTFTSVEIEKDLMPRLEEIGMALAWSRKVGIRRRKVVYNLQRAYVRRARASFMPFRSFAYLTGIWAGLHT